jgi:hypothetical protein
MNRTRLLSAGTAGLIAIGLAVAPAGAAGRPRIDLDGAGTFTSRDDGVALVGTATGDPFDGSYAGTLTPLDGTFPGPGSCEPATVEVRYDGPRAHFLELAAQGAVCGQHVQPPFVVTQVFTGRFAVAATSQRRVARTDGFLDVRLAEDGRASVDAVDT